jgi:putative heme-binding domain-containing protein
MLNGKGGILGPDLSNVAGERNLRFLEESLTKARPNIPPGYQPVRIVTSDGRQIRGVVKNEHNFSLQVLGEDGKLHLLARDELRQVEYLKQSLMPSNYDTTLSPADLRDLMAFLTRQGRPETMDAGPAGGRRR